MDESAWGSAQIQLAHAAQELRLDDGMHELLPDAAALDHRQRPADP